MHNFFFLFFTFHIRIFCGYCSWKETLEWYGVLTCKLLQLNLVENFRCIFLPVVRSAVTRADDVVAFDEMVAGIQRKYYMLGGKGGVGKTSCAASLAVKFANHGHPTIVVSTDPAHSLSDSFAQVLVPLFMCWVKLAPPPSHPQPPALFFFYILVNSKLLHD